jgi:lipopolysaccharide transport protein LptA/LPS export ABC transporter protein LptC
MTAVRFFSKDDKNQPMTLVAKSVLETNPEKKIITLTEPSAEYVMENKTILTSSSSYGLAFQKEEYLYFEDEVDTKTNDGWTVKSRQVIYDYQKGILESEAPVRITGPDGTLTADNGFYITNKGQHITFNGHIDSVITSVSDKIHLTAEKEMIINQPKRTMTAVQDVVVIQNGYKITADKMVLHYLPKGKGKERIEKVIAIGHVVADNKTQKISGDKGVYNPQTNVIEMTGNVVLTQGQNKAYGSTATLNLQTGVSSLTAKENNKPARIKGQLIPSDLQ